MFYNDCSLRIKKLGNPGHPISFWVILLGELSHFRLTILAGADVLQSLWCAIFILGAEALVVWVFLGGGQSVIVRCVQTSCDSVFGRVASIPASQKTTPCISKIKRYISQILIAEFNPQNRPGCLVITEAIKTNQPANKSSIKKCTNNLTPVVAYLSGMALQRSLS
jgi:hypothetical protein